MLWSEIHSILSWTQTETQIKLSVWGVTAREGCIGLRTPDFCQNHCPFPEAAEEIKIIFFPIIVEVWAGWRTPHIFPCVPSESVSVACNMPSEQAECRSVGQLGVVRPRSIEECQESSGILCTSRQHPGLVFQHGLGRSWSRGRVFGRGREECNSSTLDGGCGIKNEPSRGFHQNRETQVCVKRNACLNQSFLFALLLEIAYL